jgi:ADP-ribose pyrophosphatase
MIKPWPCIRSRSEGSYHVYSIRSDTVVSPRTGMEHDFHIIESGDWVNVIPLTDDGQVVMIRQYRVGSGTVTLEIPGGLAEEGDTPEQAAVRELMEETGYEAREWVKIGETNPNPAIFNNRCHTFLAKGAKKTREQMFDQTEDIEVEEVPLSDVPDLIGKGEVDHALVIAAFFWYFHDVWKG